MRTERQLIGLKRWLIGLKMTQEDIGKKAGVCRSLVSHTISGRRKNQKVIDFLLSKGCPRDLIE